MIVFESFGTYDIEMGETLKITEDYESILQKGVKRKRETSLGILKYKIDFNVSPWKNDSKNDGITLGKP